MMHGPINIRLTNIYFQWFTALTANDCSDCCVQCNMPRRRRLKQHSRNTSNRHSPEDKNRHGTGCSPRIGVGKLLTGVHDSVVVTSALFSADRFREKSEHALCKFKHVPPIRQEMQQFY